MTDLEFEDEEVDGLSGDEGVEVVEDVLDEVMLVDVVDGEESMDEVEVVDSLLVGEVVHEIKTTFELPTHTLLNNLHQLCVLLVVADVVFQVVHQHVLHHLVQKQLFTPNLSPTLIHILLLIFIQLVRIHGKSILQIVYQLVTFVCFVFVFENYLYYQCPQFIIYIE